MAVSASVCYVAVAIPVFIWLSWAAFYYPLATYSYWMDIWEHAAVINEWMKDLWHPKNPHLPIDTGSPRYMPYFLLLSCIGRLFDLEALQILGLGGVLNVAALLTGIFLFFRVYFKDEWAPVIGGAIMLGAWGIAWIWPNNYQLRSLFYVSSYPAMFAMAASLFVFWVAVKLIRDEVCSLWWYVVLAALVFVIVLSHQPTGAFAIASLFILAVFEPSASLVYRVKLTIFVLLGILLTGFWPYFSLWDLVVGTPSSAWDKSALTGQSWIKSSMSAAISGRGPLNKFYSPIVIIMSFAPALLGLPIIIYLAYRKTKLFIVAGFLLMMTLYVVNMFFPIPVAYRYLYFSIFYLHLALAWSVLTVLRYSKTLEQQRPHKRSRVLIGVTSGMIVLAFGGNLLLAALMFAGYHPRMTIDPPHKIEDIKRYSRIQPVVSDMQQIATHIPDDAVVLGIPWMVWPLPTFKGKITAVNHPNPFVLDGGRRKADALKFFEPTTSYLERREILQRYHATHIVYRQDNTSATVIAGIDKLGNVVGIVKSNVIIELF
ncbi:MAG: hypothetical protein GY777_05600 [Candidatus Brocadiaceae bacterium]|nr:hypothetical protein [Candidatus Brocadiaceae bacterium]